MREESLWTCISRPKSVLAASTVVAMLYAGTSFGQEAANPPALSLLNQPPKLDYAKICTNAPPALPMATDWAKWNDKDNSVPAEQMLSDAKRLADGDGEVHRDRALARKLFGHIASGTSSSAAEAKTRLAILLLDPKSGPVDKDRAARLLAEATAAQETNAALVMGKLMRESRLPNATIAEAIRYLSIAAGLGDPAAALQLAAIYSRPDLAPPFPDAAAHFATLAAINVQTSLASGDCGIAIDVAEYLIDTNPEQGRALATAWFDIAAQAGEPTALARVARMYEIGDGRDRNIAKAKDFWDRAVAAGLVRAFAPAARIRLAAGEDFPSAVKLLDKSMANGDPDGYLMAARFYRGDYTGKADLPAMHKVLDAAIKQTDVSPFTMDILARAYMTGLGITVDREKADALYHRLLATGLPDAEALYARYLIENGLDLSQGVRHLQNAAAKGSQIGKYELADAALCMGMPDGEQLMADAAGAGSAAAFRRLARIAADRRDQTAAIDNWQKAAELGDRLSMIELAALSMSGNAVAGVNPAILIKQAAAFGPGVIDGRLGLSTAYRNGRLGEASEGDRMLASLADSQRPDVGVEFAEYALAAAGGNELEDISQRLSAAADAGNGKAMLMLARLPSSPKTGRAEAGEWLIRSAETGEADALKEVPTNEPAVLARILASLKKRLLCDVPSLVQMARLARIQGALSDADAAMKQAEAIANRRARDIFILAEAFAMRGQGAADDPAKAAALFEKSAVDGYGKSALALANLYASGRLGPKDMEAIGWYRQAVIAGEASALRELVRRASEQSTQTNSQLALTALRQVADGGDAAAMHAYGSLLTTIGPDRYEEGVLFLHKAAGKGEVKAMKTLARMFAAGLNGAASAEESTRWIKRAAERGDAEAMFQYAIALDLGFGTKADRILAESWYQKAKQNGFVR